MIETAQEFLAANWFWFLLGLVILWAVLGRLVKRQEQREYQLWLDSLSEDEREQYFAEEREWLRARARRARKQRLEREARQREWHKYMIYSGDYDSHG